MVSELKSVWAATDRSSEDTAEYKERGVTESRSLLVAPRLAETARDISRYWAKEV